MIQKRNIIMMMCATALLSSCHIYKAYDRPDSIDASGIYRDPISETDTLAVTDTANIANVSWKEIFTDPKLQALIEEGLENNVNMQAAVLRVEEAKVMLTSARLAYLPSINFAPQGTITTISSGDYAKAYSTPASGLVWQIVELKPRTKDGISSKPIFPAGCTFSTHLWHCEHLLYLADVGPSSGNHSRDSRYL